MPKKKELGANCLRCLSFEGVKQNNKNWSLGLAGHIRELKNKNKRLQVAYTRVHV